MILFVLEHEYFVLEHELDCARAQHFVLEHVLEHKIFVLEQKNELLTPLVHHRGRGVGGDWDGR